MARAPSRPNRRAHRPILQLSETRPRPAKLAHLSVCRSRSRFSYRKSATGSSRYEQFGLDRQIDDASESGFVEIDARLAFKIVCDCALDKIVAETVIGLSVDLRSTVFEPSQLKAPTVARILDLPVHFHVTIAVGKCAVLSRIGCKLV